MSNWGFLSSLKSSVKHVLSQGKYNKYWCKVTLVLCSIGIVLCPGAVSAAANVQFNTVKTIDLPGKGGKGDIVAADPVAHKVYIAQKTNNNIIVVDSDTNTVSAVVYGTMMGNGVAFSPDYIFAASESDNNVTVISKKDWSIVTKLDASGKASDGIYYISKEKTVAVVNDESNNMTFFSATSPFKSLGSISLKPDDPQSGPDIGVYVEQTNTIYQPVDNNVLVINANTHKIEKVWTFDIQLTKLGGAKGIVFDPVKNVLYVGTTNKKILVVDPNTGTLVGTIAASAGQDQLSADFQNRLLFAGEGAIGKAAVVDMDTMEPLPDLDLGGVDAGVHTLDVLPGSSTLYAYQEKANKVLAIKINKPTKIVPLATSPVTGLPLLPIAAIALSLIAFGFFFLRFKRHTEK
ncbi:DNA-binding beta-propeller fold protein YncE [Paenibacillus sp. yr247]|uniref:YncE family protein n=1 Tax=Paenibacillus sp. yr247 TaxID=1761880 RepID=UPI00088D4E0D|nr:YncE family protein [Paenibacillus sp. yr247]SDP23129.1 DNA-binding beta-propeller fold protein YncE [Paenibacillus sp. yr247]